MSPQFFIEARAGVEHLSLDYGTALDSTLLAAAIEYQCATLPISVFGRYTHISQKYSDDTDTDTSDRIVVGAKWNFGGKSLWDRETGGAALDPFEPIHFASHSVK